MSGEVAALAAEVSPYVTAAIAAYGGAVLVKAEDQAADATVGLGRRLLQRIFSTGKQPEDAPNAVRELAADPDDLDLQAVLRVAIRRALAADPDLTDDIRGMLAATSVSVTASGERSIAAQTIIGIAATGDSSNISR